MDRLPDAEADTMVIDRVPVEYRGRHWAPLASVGDYLRVESPYRPHVPRHAEDGAR